MHVGTSFPQLTVGTDPETIRAYAETAEDCGYHHLVAGEHVVGANPDREGGWDGPYDVTDPFHEPLALFSHLAAITDDLRFVTGILILPQRQTALVAKQAAELDVLSDGRLTLGVAVGWNPLEFVALGERFDRRGRRIEEQVEVLRALWTEESVDYDGEFHDVPDVGINPRPVQRPVPVWMGGNADPVVERTARLADGWIPHLEPDAEGERRLERFEELVREAGRDPDDVAVHGRLSAAQDDDDLLDRVTAWDDLGVSHLSVGPATADPTAARETLRTVGERLSDHGYL